jgi:PAS domain S-box-containing protein
MITLILQPLVENAILLLCLSLIYDLIYLHEETEPKLLNEIFSGILITFVVIVVMSKPLILSPGLIFDTRSILISLSGLFFGPVATGILLVMSISYRILIGGPGMAMGISVIITSASIGLIWNKIRIKPLTRLGVVELYLFGMLVHVVMLLCSFALPSSIQKDTLLDIGLPVLLIYPMVTVLLGKLLIHQRSRNESKKLLLVIQNRLQMIIQATHVGLWDWDLQNNVIWFSPELKGQIGYTDSEINNDYTEWESRIHPDDLEQIKNLKQSCLDGSKPNCRAEFRLRHKNGSYLWILSEVSVKADQQGKPVRIFGSQINITKQKKVGQELYEREKLLSIIFKTVGDVIFHLAVEPNEQYRFISVNPAFLRVTGLPSKAVVGKLVNDVIPEPSLTMVLGKYKQAIREKTIIRWEETSDYPTGRLVGEVSIAPYFDEPGNCTYLIGTVHDITQRKHDEEKIQNSLKEKEILIRELYHRTKNNMQVISAMLRIYARHHDNQELKAILKEIDNKIISMALVHKKLYESNDLSHLNLKEYFQNLVELIKESYGRLSEQITFTLKGDDVMVLIDTAIPCGLVINELISNCIKHAFPGDRKGAIIINLFLTAKRELQIEVADNGIGFPKEFDLKKYGKLGLETAVDLVHHQLDGTIHFISQKGLLCRIVLREELYRPRI